MPPKGTRHRSGPKVNKSKSNGKVTDCSIQTEDDYNSELLNYQQEISILKKSNEEYKAQILALQTEITTLKNQNKKSNDKIDLTERNSTKLINEKVTSSGGIKTKGCNCKGNCSSKICGCVKKSISCQEFCKCSQALCKNQDLDKENIEQAVLSEESEKVLERLGGLTLNQEFLHASQKKIKRSIFSPFNTNNKITDKNTTPPASPLTFVTKRRLFTQDSEELVDIKPDNEESKIITENRYEKYIDDINNLDVLSMSCPLTPTTQRIRKTKNANKEQHYTVQDNKSELRIHETKEIKNSSATEQPKHINQNLKSTKDTDKSHMPQIIISNNDENQKTTEIITGSESLDELVTHNHNHEKNQSKFNKVIHSPPQLNYSIEPKEEQNINRVNHMNEEIKSNPVFIKVQHSPKLNCYETSVSSISEKKSSANNDTSDVSLNPMIPKRQLPRSPINTIKTVIIPSDNKRFSPPKKELAVAEVNWEEHQSQLVLCKFCKRKFFPHRIEKHERSCKKI